MIISCTLNQHVHIRSDHCLYQRDVPHTLLYKKSTLDSGFLANYRQIYNLPFISKILGKAVAKQLCDLCKNNFYEHFKSGFRVHHSTETALTRVTGSLHLASNNKLLSILIQSISQTSLRKGQRPGCPVVLCCTSALKTSEICYLIIYIYTLHGRALSSTIRILRVILNLAYRGNL